MTAWQARLLLGVALLGGVHLLREATESTHYATGADTRLILVVEASSHGAEPGVSMDALARAQVAMCALEVSRTPEHGAVPVPDSDGVYRITIQPALDSTNRKQYSGCLEDWSIDHFRLRVVSMTEATAHGEVEMAPTS